MDEQKSDETSIIPEPNYPVITEMKYEDGKKYRNVNYHSKSNPQEDHFAVHIPCIEDQVVSNIATNIKKCSSVQYVDHKHVVYGSALNSHVVIVYESNNSEYMSSAREIVRIARDIRSSMTICEEYNPESDIDDRVGHNSDNLKYIW